ncbi:type IV secretion system protein (plasmid) [Cupriavidus basilensis]
MPASNRESEQIHISIRRRKSLTWLKNGDMNLFRKSPRAESATKAPPDFTPGPPEEAARRVHYEMGAGSRIERNRWFLISCVLGLALLAHGVGISFLFPLKSVEPVVILQSESGRRVVDTSQSGSWVPDQPALSFSLNQWVEWVFAINGATVEGNLARAASRTVGTASDQLRDLRRKENPLVLLRDNPRLVREYENLSINFIGNGGAALIRFRTTTRRAPGTLAEPRTYAMTINFNVIKPTTREEILKDPAGVYITGFNLTDEATIK